jgi:outer membrane protein assembly factor BamC
MEVLKLLLPARILLLAAGAVLVLGGCESMTTSMGKKIDYKSVATAPALELPPDLTAPQYDDRYNVATASAAAAARDASRPRTSDQVAPASTPDARIVRGGNDRWLVVKATPEQAWSTVRQFWLDTGFVLAVEQPVIGVMETDWAENRADLPTDIIRSTLGKFADILYTTYKRDKFRTRIERGIEPGTVEIYISHRGAEQMPTAKVEGNQPVAFAWTVLPPNPGLETELLTRLMVRFGAVESVARASVQQAVTPGAAASDRARLVKSADGTNALEVDDNFDRAWRRVGLALDRIGFTVVDRDRSKGVYFVRFADPDTAKVEPGWLSKLQFWKDTTEKPEQYRVVVTGGEPRSTVVVQNVDGAPDRSPNGEKILSLVRDQLK